MVTIEVPAPVRSIAAVSGARPDEGTSPPGTRPTWPGRASTTPAGSRAHVVGVIGARGGAGASTLASALADRLARLTATVLVDADSASPGLDVLVGVEREAGLRWPDLHDARGEVDGTDLLGLLPRWGRCAVLSADRTRPGPPPADVVPDVLGALRGAAGAVVLDLGRADVLAGSAPVDACGTVLLVVPRDLRAVAGALAVRAALAARAAGQGRAEPDVRLVVRGPAPGGLGVAEVEEAVDRPVLCAVREDRRLAAHLERALVPRSGPLGVAAGRAARLVLAGERG
ncbi:septum site-determining protein Ssd [Cellulomonas soli]|uniref:septum site-determining protein Ssd n=1 Tax=Cellulomonas soli TaxID=931535 RepID=UPI003F8547FC